MAVTVLLVEDVSELRSVLRQSLQLRGGFDVVAEAGDGSAAIVAAARHQPDVVVLDLGLPDIAGQERSSPGCGRSPRRPRWSSTPARSVPTACAWRSTSRAS